MAAIHLRAHTFAGNPFRSNNSRALSINSPAAALVALKSLLSGSQDAPFLPAFKVLAFKRGKLLARSSSYPKWHLAWAPPHHFREFPAECFVYLGAALPLEETETVYWAIDVSNAPGIALGGGGDGSCFVELRTLMIATDWNDELAMGELAIAGHARAVLEWHNTSGFCGRCGMETIPIDAGRRKQCANDSCKKRIYPRIDPVVIMLVIDKENDRALLGRQSRFVPHMWSCLAGFIEPGESLEEAVKRETWEETGIEVGEVIYHSSQPWPAGPSSMPCQLMVGFFAYAKSLDIRVDKKELEDAQWHKREDVKKALGVAEYEKAQQTEAKKVHQMCAGVEEGRSLREDFNVESGELAPMSVPGPFAIAHHLISSWAHHGPPSPHPVETAASLPSTSISSL